MTSSMESPIISLEIVTFHPKIAIVIAKILLACGTGANHFEFISFNYSAITQSNS